ncbi:MAG TPA: glycosyltransferase family 1 protein [Polyangiaceae bacterium]|nr:glycosyltransferase family 1 protein [Polyangiaceae bacterium]
MRHSRRAVAIALAGCDLGNSGLSVFAESMIPRFIDRLRAGGIDPIVLGTARERRAAGLDDAPGPTLPSLADSAGPSAALSLAGISSVARLAGADLLYLPCANRRIVGLGTIPVIGTVHDLAQFHVAAKYGPLRQIYVKRVLVPLLRRLRIVTTVSQATADDVLKYAGVPLSRIRVIPNGIAISPPARTALAQPGPYFLYPARLEHPGKNHLRVLGAFARSSTRETHSLILSGAEWGAGPLIRARAEALGISARVHVIGFVGRDEFARLMGGADAIIAAGLHEGFGLPAAEALACGVVVAASCTGSLPEVVGDMGVFFDPLDEDSIARALERAAGDEELRDRCRRLGPVCAARFSWDHSASKLAGAVEEVLRAAA